MTNYEKPTTDISDIYITIKTKHLFPRRTPNFRFSLILLILQTADGKSAILNVRTNTSVKIQFTHIYFNRVRIKDQDKRQVNNARTYLIAYLQTFETKFIQCSVTITKGTATSSLQMNLSLHWMANILQFLKLFWIQIKYSHHFHSILFKGQFVWITKSVSPSADYLTK